MFNSTSFNSSQYNAAGSSEGPSLDVEIIEAINLIDFPSPPPVFETVEDGLEMIVVLSELSIVPFSDLMLMGDSVNSSLVLQILEAVTVADTLNSNALQSIFLQDGVSMQEALAITLPVILTENLEASVTLEGILQKYSTILNSVRVSSTWASVGNLSAIISASIAIMAAVEKGILVEVLTEGLEVSSELVELFIATENILNAINVEDLPEDSVVLTVITTEDLSVALSQDLSTVYSLEVEEEAVFLVSYKIEETIYQGYSYSPETYSVTEYENFDFNSSAFFNYNYLFANETGLYLLGGDMDDDQFITAKIKTATMDFESSNLKQIPKVYLGISNDASLILSVAVDGKYKAQYELQLDSNDLSTQMFNIGKGLVGRYWQFTLETKGNTSFDLDEIEIYPIIFGRKR